MKRNNNTSCFLLLSFPRSGNSLIKHFLNKSIYSSSISDCLFMRYKQKDMSHWIDACLEKDLILFKEHGSRFCNYFDPSADNLIFILRNYKECIPRHIGIAKTETQKHRNNACELYTDNVLFFDKWSGNKILLYYEDLMTDYKAQLIKLGEKLNISDTPMFKNSLNNYQILSDETMFRYNKLHVSYTKGAHNIFHSKNLTAETKKEMDQFMINKKIGKYIKRYEETK